MEKFEDILKFATGNLAQEEKEKVLSKIEAKKENREIFGKVKIAWAFIRSGKRLSDYDKENLYLKIKDEISGKKVRRIPNIAMVLRYAAIVIFMISISTTYYFVDKYQFNRSGLVGDLSYTSFITENGQRSKVVLPDGSVVWLNSGTTLKYPNNFSKGIRNVSVEGQAFFQVTHNEKSPFIVRANGIIVSVLGTRFDVDAYPEKDEIAIVLESGKVELSHQNFESFSYTMQPGEKAVFQSADNNSLNVSRVEAEVYSSWKDGKLIFRNSSMKEVVEKLQRWYDIKIKIVDSDVYNSIFSGTIQNESYEEIFRLIGIACDVDCSIIYGYNYEAKPQVIIAKK